jgi:hypothetical protein
MNYLFPDWTDELDGKLLRNMLATARELSDREALA